MALTSNQNNTHEVSIPSDISIEEQRKRLRHIINVGKKQGYLTYSEIHDYFSSKISNDQLENIINMIKSVGIQVSEEVPDIRQLENREVKKATDKIERVINIFKTSNAKIRPHFIVIGSSGAGKSYTIQQLTAQANLNYLEINAAQLTKEGTSGNSLSKALTPLLKCGDRMTVCFVDEFDKLFISGNTNNQLAHETTNGVQNEFLKVLESNIACVYGDYGKYVNAYVDKVLFVFAGAFNGEQPITLDRLRDFGVKTEFLGRVGLVFNLHKLTISELLEILNKSTLLYDYLKLFPSVKKNDCVALIGAYIKDNYENNTIGARIISNLIHSYFINEGVLTEEDAKLSTFQTTCNNQNSV
jgi:ATP-dependent protease Clp ATPase subunit